MNIIQKTATENDHKKINPHKKKPIPNNESCNTMTHKKIWTTFTYTGK
jgi:hypothetical protein